MELTQIVFCGLIVGVLIYIISIFNHLVRLKHNVSKAWSNIDVLLKQRHDEIPKLVQVCKQYSNFEQETLEKVMFARGRVSDARQSQNIPDLGPAEATLRMGIGQLFGLVENYPDLKANETFQQLQDRISALEDSIADRREFYNDCVNLNNIAIDQFPDLMVARVFSFGRRELLEFDSSRFVDINFASSLN